MVEWVHTWVWGHSKSMTIDSTIGTWQYIYKRMTNDSTTGIVQGGYF